MLVPKLRFKREDGTDYLEWNKKHLNKCATFHSGLTYSPSDVTDSDNGVLVIRSTNIQNGALVYKDNVFVNVEISEKLKLQLNDTVMCVRNGSKSLVGKNALVRHKDLDKTWGAFMTVLRSIEPNCFIHHYLNSPYFKRQMDINAGTSTINQITSSMLNECVLFVPTDLKEQQKIADFLSTVDEVIAQSEAEVQNLEQQKKAAMQKIFSQEVRFKREDGTDYPEWEEKQLGSICDMIGDGLHKAPLYDENGDYYFINGNNLKNGKIVIEKETPKVSVGTLQKSDKSLDTATILMSINGTIGNLAFYQDEKIMLGKSVAYLKVGKNVCKKYIYSVLQTRKIIDSFKLSLTGTTIKNLGLTAIRDTFIFIPCLEEQRKIADFLSAYDEAISYAKQELDKWKELKKGLLQQMFV